MVLLDDWEKHRMMYFRLRPHPLPGLYLIPLSLSIRLILRASALSVFDPSCRCLIRLFLTSVLAQLVPACSCGPAPCPVSELRPTNCPFFTTNTYGNVPYFVRPDPSTVCVLLSIISFVRSVTYHPLAMP